MSQSQGSRSPLVAAASKPEGRQHGSHHTFFYAERREFLEKRFPPSLPSPPPLSSNSHSYILLFSPTSDPFLESISPQMQLFIVPCHTTGIDKWPGT